MRPILGDSPLRRKNALRPSATRDGTTRSGSATKSPSRWRPATTRPTLAFLLSHQAPRQRLRRFLTEFSVVTYRGDDESGLWSEVFDWLIRYQDHEPDWADGYLAVVSGKERNCRVWTYDREFRTTWRRPDGTRVPLATN